MALAEIPSTESAHEPGHGLAIPTASSRMTVAALQERVREVREVQRAVLAHGADYGTIPGTPKPSLYKSGAETLLLWAGFGHRLEAVEVERDEAGRKYGVTYRCTITDGDGVVKATCDAYCGYDEPDREEGVNKWGKPRPRAPWNTIVKMAEKRALVGATLQATATSGLFTQDLEDAQPAVDTFGHDAHEALAALIKAASSETAAAARQWRKDRQEPWPMTAPRFVEFAAYVGELIATETPAGAAGRPDPAPGGGDGAEAVAEIVYEDPDERPFA